jgi:DNA-binding GntR family transcriptional regulator
MYRQIANDLREQIASGALTPGRQLPTELELRERQNGDTTRSGHVHRRAQDSVRHDPSGDPLTGLGGGEGSALLAAVSAAHRKPMNSPVQVEIQDATDEIAARLWVPEGTEVVLRH